MGVYIITLIQSTWVAVISTTDSGKSIAGPGCYCTSWELHFSSTPQKKNSFSSVFYPSLWTFFMFFASPDSTDCEQKHERASLFDGDDHTETLSTWITPTAYQIVSFCRETGAGLRGEARWRNSRCGEVRHCTGTRLETHHSRAEGWVFVFFPRRQEERDGCAGGHGESLAFLSPPLLLPHHPVCIPGKQKLPATQRQQTVTSQHKAPDSTLSQKKRKKKTADEEKVIKGCLCGERSRVGKKYKIASFAPKARSAHTWIRRSLPISWQTNKCCHTFHFFCQTLHQNSQKCRKKQILLSFFTSFMTQKL